jgi:hypothetical protein
MRFFEPMLPGHDVSVLRPMPMSIGGCLRSRAARSSGAAPDHRDRGAHGAVAVVVVRHRDAEAGHHRVADELVEHPAFLWMHVDHQREVFVQQRHRALRAELLEMRGEAADVAEEHRRLDRLAAQHLAPAATRRSATPGPCSATSST